jgi:transglutaminase-like putative cysteine protease
MCCYGERNNTKGVVVVKQYLESSEFIDWRCAEIINKARELKGDFVDDVDIAKACFEFVRDSIKHTWDFQINVITCKASDVLNAETGYCYAKSHLLAALLRANEIPAGLCYQRLSVTGNGEPYCLHGLNAIYLKEFGWYRVDPRGNKEGVTADFTPPQERLAFTTLDRLDGDVEGCFEGRWAQPMPVVTEVLSTYKTYRDVYDNLPDIQL